MRVGHTPTTRPAGPLINRYDRMLRRLACSRHLALSVAMLPVVTTGRDYQ